MKYSIAPNRKKLFPRAFQSAIITSLFIYAAMRLMAYEFPMTWKEEILLFFKVVAVSCLLITSITGGLPWMYIRGRRFYHKAGRH